MTTKEAVVFPMSFAQEGLWFLHQLNATSPFYNVPHVVRMRGVLRVDVLERALRTMVERHESLRTTFAVAEGTPVQVIAKAGSVELPVVDLTDREEEVRETVALERATTEVRRPFDLMRRPLMRTILLRLGETEHLLVLTLHHIIADGWSLAVFDRELPALYDAFVTGRASPLAPLPIQYVDFAEWQRSRLRGEMLDRLLAYWTGQLAGGSGALTLRTDRPRRPVESHRGVHHFFALAPTLAAPLKNLARREGATLFMVLLAAFSVLLHRYSGRSDLLIGSPIANRTHRDVEGLIGLFVNTLVLRTDLSGAPTFRELLRRVRTVCLEAYTHGDLPLIELVKAMRPERDLSRNPLFQVMFILQNTPAPAVTVSDLTLSPVDVELGTSEFDLTLAVRDDRDRLTGYVEYSTDLFDAATIVRMVGHYRALLAGIAADPDQRVAELPLMPTEERHELLTGWGRGREAGEGHSCVHRFFEAQVERTPDAIAVVFEDERLSYRELNRRANELAHRLQALAVRPEVLVGILMERSLDMMIAVLAVLKAGGAYVPLDPSHPPGWTEFIVRESRMQLLLTQERLAAVSAGTTRRICLDGEAPRRSAGTPAPNPASDVDPANLAYVIYTSGSTGRPKGAAMTHLALSNLISWHLQSDLGTTPPRTLQFAPLSFDVSFQEIFSTWCAGGTLVVVREAVRPDPAALLSFVSENAIERAFCPVVVLQRMLDHAVDSGGLPTTLRDVITAGEQLHIAPAAADVFGRLNGCRLHNHYGPSETHVVSTFTLPETVNGWPAQPPIGRPIANTQIYLLDESLEPVAVGVTGELHVGGAALSRGYVHRPGLTAEKFVPDPWGGRSGARLYRTGDLARWRPDGTLEFVGRADRQVKIRGFRVEPGEIEAVLRGYPSVQDAVVLVKEHAPDDRRLVAFLVPGGEDGGLSIRAVRRFLKDTLPGHMVPSAFLLLDALPITSHGKVDREALGRLETVRPDEPGRVLPGSDTELKIAEIWREVLHAGTIGVHENFFDIGGHSLLGTQVISRLRRAFGVELPLSVLFECQTIARLAEYLEAASVFRRPPEAPGSPVTDGREHGAV